ncbi:MAG: hypothetical protein ACU841_04940 [Gammaproteobacteria bacterium]
MSIALIGLAIILFSVLGAWLIIRAGSRGQPKQVKAVLFGLYFWGLAFLQLIVAAALYYLRK